MTRNRAMSTPRGTYEIEQRGPICKLTVVHELKHAPKTTKDVARGWGIVVAVLKTLLETGHPMPMPDPMWRVQTGRR
jgi:hypothetical protein